MILTVTLNSCVHKYITYRDEEPRRTVIRPVTSRFSSGGKGFNAARVVGLLGGKVRALGFAGGRNGQLLADCLEREGVPATLVEVVAETRMSHCLFEEQACQFRELLEPGEDATADEATRLSERYEAVLGECDLVTLNGSSPGPHCDPLFAGMCRSAREAGKTVILDTYGPPAPPALDVPPHWLRCNRSELESAYGLADCASLDMFLRARSDAGLVGILVSDGSGPVHCVTLDQHLVATPPVVDEVNPVGSGDALTGGFAQALLAGRSPAEALRDGVAAGTANAAELPVCEFTRERFDALAAQVRIESVQAA